VSYALFTLMGLVTASFTLTWACAKEVNPPLLSGMSTSVTNMGGFLAAALLQPLVGWVMDLTWQGGLSETGGARLYAGRFPCRPAPACRDRRLSAPWLRGGSARPVAATSGGPLRDAVRAARLPGL
jgi:hypothetical protein